jgi:lipopolysaccharide export system protein LptA
VNWIRLLTAGALLLALLAAPAAAQPPPAPAETPETPAAEPVVPFDLGPAGEPLGSFRLTRNDRVIDVQQYAPQAEGGQFRTNVPDCEPGLRLSTVFAPAPWAVVTRIAETSIVSQVVLARRPPREEGGEERETLEMFGGNLEMSEAFCPENVQRSGEADVFIVQGRTTVQGLSLFYDNATGLANLAGPVNLQRTAEDGAAIVASSENLVFNVDTEMSTLQGDVQVISDKRTSQADTLELNEQEGLATLRGTPARSTEGENVLQGDTLLYYLDTDDVVVVGGVTGTLELDLDTP